MKRGVIGLYLLLACFLLVRPAGAQSLQLAQPNAARFPEITLFAYPTDARGVLQGGLGPAHFQVTENGLPAQILRVDARGGSLDVCLALDRSRSMEEDDKLGAAKAAASEFVRLLDEHDQAALISFADGSTLDQPLTSDRQAMLAAIARAEPSGNTTTFMDAVYWSITQVALRPQGGGSLLSSAPARAESRRVVVALTDGIDLSSRVFPPEILSYARANGVSLCMVALGSDAASAQMEYLAQQTGGIYLAAPSGQDLRQLYARLAEQLHREYHITFRSPTPASDGARRNVRVQVVSGPGMDTWYQAPGQGSGLVTVAVSSPSAPFASPTASGGGKAPQGPLVAVLLLLALGGGVAGVLLWMQRQSGRLPIRDSNPRLDLLPLWVRNGETRVGRGAECEVVLDSQQVSRVHARIQAFPGGFRVVDEGSSNGTYVNGKRVKGARELRVGDTLRFGDREFQFAGALG